MPFPVVPLIVAGIGALSSWIQSRAQNKANKNLAQFQASANEKYQQQQNEYNTPKNQMARFQDAGLNRALMYGQGNPGNQSSPLSAPQSSRSVANLEQLVPLFNQSRMTESQTGAIDAKTRQTYAVTEVNKLQAQLIKANPLLNDEGFKATIDGLKNTAELKGLQGQGQIMQNQIQSMSAGHQVEKIFREVQLLEQRFNLGQQDSAIKAEVLKSKEFQNAILDVQKRFMTDGEITPQHILFFIQSLILKLF